jgi:chromosome segregation ATPase
MGPPTAVSNHIPPGEALGRPSNLPPGADPGIADAANLLGNLNAAHASPNAMAHASPNSIVGAIAAYKKATITADAAVTKYTGLVSQDQAAANTAQTNLTTAQNNLTTLQNSGTATTQQLASAQAAVDSAKAALNTANAQLSADQASLASAQAAVVSAQNTLALQANKPITPTVIAKLNTILGI